MSKYILNGPILNSLSVSNPNNMHVISGVSGTHSHGGFYVDRVGYPHMLRIVNHNEDIGQDDYYEDLEWTIMHPNECPRRMTIANQNDVILPPYVQRVQSPHGGSQYDALQIYECEMAIEIKRHGIDRLSTPWIDLEPGDYKVQLEVSKEDMYTTSNYPPQQVYDLPSRIVLL